MKRFRVERLRNLALVGHEGSGKSALLEAVLWASAPEGRPLELDAGSGALKLDADGGRRRSSGLNMAAAQWNEHRLTWLDAPGYHEYMGEVKAALRVVDCAVIVVDDEANLKVGTELSYKHVEAQGLPRVFVINKLDKDPRNFERVIASLQAKFGGNVLPFQWPLISRGQFCGVIDLVRCRAHLFGDGGTVEAEVPATLTDVMTALRERLIERAAEMSDEVMAGYLATGRLGEADLIAGLKAAMLRGHLTPVFGVSATELTGIDLFLDAMIQFAPSPLSGAMVSGVHPDGTRAERSVDEAAPFSALVFKTSIEPHAGRVSLVRVFSGTVRTDQLVRNSSRGVKEKWGQMTTWKGRAQEPVLQAGAGEIIAVSRLVSARTSDTLSSELHPVTLAGIDFPAPLLDVAIYPRHRRDDEKLQSALDRVAFEDPLVRVERRSTTGELILSTMGEVHLDQTVARLKRMFAVEAVTAEPRVAYVEAITGRAVGECCHRQQSGGRGQYARCKLEIEPLAGGDFEFVDAIVGNAIPVQYRPVVAKAVQEMMAEGVLAGHPLKGIRCTLLDGAHHEVDSSEEAFRTAARTAFRQAFFDARPVLLEPILSVQVHAPDAHLGDIFAEINKKRGRILGVERSLDGVAIVMAEVPQAEWRCLASDVRSITEGRAMLDREFHHYEEAAAAVARPILDLVAVSRQAEVDE